MEIRKFGTLPDGTEVVQYILKTEDAEVRVLNFGGVITDFIYKGQNIVCGFETIEDYLADDSYQGALIGRFANRIGGASFALNGKTYHVGANEGKNTLHGGIRGFNRRVFDVAVINNTTITLSRLSPDGEEGYPGNLTVRATYSLNGSDLTISYDAVSDQDTPISLTNHSYFNLTGVGTSILDHLATIHADRYTAVDDELIPTGEQPLVEKTPYDLRAPRKIGEMNGGYDTNFVLSNPAKGNTPTLAATVVGGALKLAIYTTQPCIQFYTGCVLEGTPDFRGGVKKAKFTAFCLETQAEPDAPRKGEAILRAGEKYAHTTVYHIETN